MASDRVCAVVVNWNGWRDTIECLESVLRSEGVAVTVAVCDNGSTDGSLDRLRDWAAGRLDCFVDPANPLRDLSWPPLPKPIRCARVSGPGLAQGEDPDEARLVLIENGANLGFAGGSNVGLRYALNRGGFDFVWLLNNDTAVHPHALRELIAELRRDPGIGMAGSTLLYYDAPEVVQTLGGASYNRWLALPRHIGAFARFDPDTVDREAVLRRMDYVSGASMLVSRGFLEDVGPLNEQYFLFFEELDWAMRARGRWRLGYAPNSVVYHREGGSIGSGSRGESKSATADYHFVRSRLRFTRRFQPQAIPTVYAALGVSMLRRVRRREWDRVRMIARLCAGR